MKDEDFEKLMRDAAHTYRRPPRMTDADATWRAIEGALPAAGETPPELGLVEAHDVAPRRPAAHPARNHAAWTRPWTHPLARMAAMLLVGVAVGRASVGRTSDAPATDVVATGVAAPARSAAGGQRADAEPSAERVATDMYLVRTAALLAGLPDELSARRGDAAFRSQADALLLQTRLLLDSPAAADPALRALLDDLEIVLAQVVRLDAAAGGRNQMEVEFLHEALEQRDVLPRLRDAVAENAADLAAD